MLKKLRMRMVLLTAAISGAILLAMALVALSVAERTIATQYESDLQQNATMMLSTMQGMPGNVRIQFASRYVVFFRNGDETQMMATDNVDADAVVRAIDQAAEMLTAKTGRLSDDVAVPEDGLTVQRFFIAQTALGSGDEPPDTLYLRQHSLYTLPGLLLEAGEKRYRVSATMSTGEPVQQLFVLQDRVDELASVARLRWLFLGCAVGGLLLTGLASLYLSTRSIRPVERSMRQQHAFVAAASHELRTPVAAVRANAEVLADAPLGEFAPYLAAIAQESTRMSRLVSDLMDLARGDAGELQVRQETVDAADVAKRAVTLLAPLVIPKQHTLETALQPALCRADAERLCQVLVILLDNAVRYTPEGGHIHVSTRKSGSGVLIEVIDNGAGIPDAQKQKVFERFYRLDAARSADGGCGLGLSIAHQLIEQMNGTLTLADNAGGGCSFQIRLKAER